MTPGELKRRAQQKNLLTSALFAKDNDKLVDVQVITLQQHLKELAYAEAWQHPYTDTSELCERADVLMSTKYHSAKEFVFIENNRIVVGVNADKIDDAAVDYALVLLSQIEKFELGVRTEIGELIHAYDT